MEPSFWHARWEENQIAFHQDEINAHLQSYWERLGLPPRARVFVPLCGKSRDMLWLLGRGYRVLGVELSPIAVRDFFAENGLAPAQEQAGPFSRCAADGVEILCGDFFNLTPANLAEVEGVYDRASLIALPPAMRQRYADVMKRSLPASARVILVTMEYRQEEMQGPPFAVDEDEVRRLYADRFDVAVLYRRDVLEENERFKARGLTALAEKVYLLTPRPL